MNELEIYRLNLLNQKLNIQELEIKIAVLNKQFWSNKDIAIMMNCKKATASKHRSKIIKYIKSLGHDVPPQIPSNIAIKALSIDESSIRKKYKETLEVSRFDYNQQSNSTRAIKAV